ncbi:hypothetical protein [Phocaeicola sp.]
MMIDTASAYKQLNRSFEKSLIFHAGIDAGFFAEYSYMVNAMLYCLQHKIQFKLYSADANFGYRKGWNDYFAPFCEEVNEPFHHKYNMHAIPSWSRLIALSAKQKSLHLLKWKLKVSYQTTVGTQIAARIYGKGTLLTHHVKFNPHCHFHIPELGIDGDYMHAFNKMADICWQLNNETASACNALISELQLPKRYIGCQIRGGDKITEVNLLPPDFYVSIIRKETTERNVFVLTDDYRIFEHLQTAYPDIHWYTLCSPEEKGYVNSAFIQTEGNRKQKQMTRFLASMQILLKSVHFIGSITTGPSLFVLKKLYPNIRLVDCAPEQFAEIITLPIPERGKLAEEYLRKLG